jgi:hypothetical protein
MTPPASMRRPSWQFMLRWCQEGWVDLSPAEREVVEQVTHDPHPAAWRQWHLARAYWRLGGPTYIRPPARPPQYDPEPRRFCCVQCGVDHIASAANQRVCAECRRNSGSPSRTFRCVQCGEEDITWGVGKLYCSQRCRTKFKAAERFAETVTSDPNRERVP